MSGCWNYGRGGGWIGDRGSGGCGSNYSIIGGRLGGCGVLRDGSIVLYRGIGIFGWIFIGIIFVDKIFFGIK